MLVLSSEGIEMSAYVGSKYACTVGSSRHAPEEVGSTPKQVGDKSITFLELLS